MAARDWIYTLGEEYSRITLSNKPIHHSILLVVNKIVLRHEYSSNFCFVIVIYTLDILDRFTL